MVKGAKAMRTKVVIDGRVQGYYVQPHHERAVAAFRELHGYKSNSRAMRAVLDELARAVGVPLPQPKEAA